MNKEKYYKSEAFAAIHETNFNGFGGCCDHPNLLPVDDDIT